MRKNDIVEVTWMDIVQDPTWQKEDDATVAKPVLCKSVGYFLDRTDKFLRISESMNNLGERSVQVFPIGTVLKVRKL